MLFGLALFELATDAGTHAFAVHVPETAAV
jgi:hypothetical protein